MKTVKLRKNEVDEVIRLLKKSKRSSDSDYYALALKSIKPIGDYKVDNVDVVRIINLCIIRFGYSSKGINARIYSLLSFYNFEIVEIGRASCRERV